MTTSTPPNAGNAAASREAGRRTTWSPRALAGLALAFAATMAGILHFGVRQVPSIRSVPPQTNTFTLISSLQSLQNIESLPWLDSPTLFALPSIQGFSGPAWIQYLAPSLPLDVSPTETHWVPFSTNELGSTLAQLAEEDRPRDSSVTDHIIPWRENFPIDTPPPGKSMLRREGPVAMRRMLNPEPIPTWTHPDVLLDTQVQVLVDPAGRTLTASIVEPPGSALTRLQAVGARSAEADQFALEYARRASYSRLTPYLAMEKGSATTQDPLSWGYLIFQWHTVPPAPTNAPPASNTL